MEIKLIKAIQFDQNAYLIIKDNKDAILIDPGYQLKEIQEVIKKDELSLKGILLTHFHFDHAAAAEELANKHNVKVHIHEGDKELLMDNDLASYRSLPNVTIPETLIETFKTSPEIDGFEIEGIWSPGHSEGSTLFNISNELFTGDVLFETSVGRVDLPGSDPSKMISSLKWLIQLDGSLKCNPGHGESAILRDIIKTNEVYRNSIK